MAAFPAGAVAKCRPGRKKGKKSELPLDAFSRFLSLSLSFRGATKLLRQTHKSSCGKDKSILVSCVLRQMEIMKAFEDSLYVELSSISTETTPFNQPTAEWTLSFPRARNGDMTAIKMTIIRAYVNTHFGCAVVALLKNFPSHAAQRASEAKITS